MENYEVKSVSALLKPIACTQIFAYLFRLRSGWGPVEKHFEIFADFGFQLLAVFGIFLGVLSKVLLLITAVFQMSALPSLSVFGHISQLKLPPFGPANLGANPAVIHVGDLTQV